MKCQECNRTVTRKSKFCPHCGKKIVPRTSTKKAQKRAKLPLGQAIGLIVIGLVIGYLVFRGNGEEPAAVHTASGFQSSAGFENAVADIAREFDCTCGTCNHSLDECDCNHAGGAVEVKGFIVQKIRENHHKPHIIEMVQQQYGGLKNRPVPALEFDLPTK